MRCSKRTSVVEHSKAAEDTYQALMLMDWLGLLLLAVHAAPRSNTKCSEMVTSNKRRQEFAVAN